MLKAIIWINLFFKDLNIFPWYRETAKWPVPANIRLDEDVLIKTIYSSWSYVFKTSSRRFQDVLPRCLQDVFKTSSRRLQDVFKTSSRRLAKTSSRHLQDVFKTFWRRLQDVLQRYLQDVFKTYHQVKLFLLTNLRDVFNTFLRRTAKTVIYRRICLGHTSEKFMVSVQNLRELSLRKYWTVLNC